VRTLRVGLGVYFVVERQRQSVSDVTMWSAVSHGDPALSD